MGKAFEKEQTPACCVTTQLRTPETNTTLQIGRRPVAAPWGGVGGDRWEQQAQGEGPAAGGRADRQRDREPAETLGVPAGSRHLDTASQVLFSVSADR